LMYTDVQYGPGDFLTIEFDIPTNMPPVGRTNVVIPRFDLEMFLVFSKKLARNAIDADAYFGYWESSTKLIIRVMDPGYPQPSLLNMVVSIPNGTSFYCETFNRSSAVFQTVSISSHKYCLTNAAGTSLHKPSTSSPLQGHFGLRLPAVAGVDMKKPNSVEAAYFGVGTTLLVFADPPLSAEQVNTICAGGAGGVFILDVFGDDVSAGLDCYSLMPDGTLSSTDYTPEEKKCLFEYESLSAADQLTCDLNAPVAGAPTARRRRAATSSYPTRTVFSIKFLNMSYSPLMGASSSSLLQAVIDSFNIAALANLLGSPSLALALLRYTSSLNLTRVNASSVFVLGSSSETPLLYSIQASATATAKFLTLEFTQDTNLLSSSATDYSISQTDLNLLFSFSPSLGTSYSATWTSRRKLVVSVFNKNPAIIYPQNVSLTFVPSRLADGTILQDPCRGVPVCGKSAASWGVCNIAETSCRAYGTYAGSSITGSWEYSEASVTTTSSSDSKLYLLLLIPGFIVTVIVAILLHRHYKRKNQKKEITRVMRAWRSKFKDDKKDNIPFGDNAEVWSRPPAMVAMRNNADPFLNVNDSHASPTPTASLPAPLPPAFAPRATATIASPENTDLSPPLPPLKGARLSSFVTSPPQMQRMPGLPSLSNSLGASSGMAPAFAGGFPGGFPGPSANGGFGGQAGGFAGGFPVTSVGGFPGGFTGTSAGVGTGPVSPTFGAGPFPRRPSRDLFAPPAPLGATAASPSPAVLPSTLRRTSSDMQRPTLPGLSSNSFQSLPRPPSFRLDPFAAAPTARPLSMEPARDPFARPAALSPLPSVPVARRPPTLFAQMQMPQRPSRPSFSGIPEGPVSAGPGAAAAVLTAASVAPSTNNAANTSQPQSGEPVGDDKQ